MTERTDVTEKGARLALITTGVLLATLMQTLDTSIANVALPIIQGNLGATIDEGAWVVTGYIISAVIIIPLTPWLQMRFGRRQYYGTAIVGFTVASMFCGFSSSITELIFWRIVQGLFGGGLVATAQATLSDTFPRDRLGASQAIFALGALVGPTLGPTLGGWLTDNFSWNYVFFINLVPGAVAAIIIFTELRNPNEPSSMQLDVVGLSLLAIGLGSLQYVLDEGQRNDWFNDRVILFFATTATLGILAFAYWEWFGTSRPIVDLHALRERSIAAGALLGFAIGAALFGTIVLLPQFVQGILNFTATLSGELIFMRAIVIAMLTPFVARIASAAKFDTRYLLAVGFSLVGVSSFMLYGVTTSTTPFWSMVPPMFLSGLGLALVFTPLSIAVLGSIPRELAPKASAFQSLALQLGGSFSTALLVTLLAQRTAFHQDVIAGTVTLAHPAVSNFLARGGGIGQIYALVLQQAATQGYADAWVALGIVSFVLMPLVFVLRRPRPMGGVAISAE